MCHKQIIQCFPLMENMQNKFWDETLAWHWEWRCPSLFRNTGSQSLTNLIYMKHYLLGSLIEMILGNISTCVIFSGQLAMSLCGCVDSRQCRLYCSWFTKVSPWARILNLFKPWVVFKLKETNRCTQVVVFAFSVALAIPPSCICRAVLPLAALSGVAALCVQCVLHSSYSGFLGLCSSERRPSSGASSLLWPQVFLNFFKAR